MGDAPKVSGPDLAAGVAASELVDGKPLVGHVGDEGVMLVRRGEEVFATGATCTHYSGPLAEGLVVGDTVRCPWHHACFDLRTGEALKAPALNPIACYEVVRDGDRVRVGRQARRRQQPPSPPTDEPKRIVIVGAGAAGHACAEQLRLRGYRGQLVMIGADAAGAGRSAQPVEGLSRRQRARGVDPAASAPSGTPSTASSSRSARAWSRSIRTSARSPLENGRSYGIRSAAARHRRRADPAARIPGAELAARPLSAHARRQPADHRRAPRRHSAPSSSAPASSGSRWPRRCARARSRCTWWRPTRCRSARVLGNELGAYLKSAARGARRAVPPRSQAGGDRGGTGGALAVRLDDGSALACDFVVVGIGVRPAIALAEKAGLDGRQRHRRRPPARAPATRSIYAAGDLARYPDRALGQAHPRRALGRGPAPGADRGAQHARRRASRSTTCPSSGARTTTSASTTSATASGYDRVELDGSPAAHDCSVAFLRRRRAGRAGDDLPRPGEPGHRAANWRKIVA